MRKLILILFILLCFAVPSSARMVIGSGAAGVEEGLIFHWDMETNNANYPAGKTATYNGSSLSTTQYHAGARSLYSSMGQKWASFAVSTNDIFNPSVGTIDLYFYLTTFAEYAVIFRGYIDANNWIKIRHTGTDEIKLSWYGNTTLVAVATTNANIATGQWYHCVAKYRTGANDPTLSIQIDATTAVTSNTDLTPWVGTLATIQIGETDGIASVEYIDDLKIYNIWK